MAREAIDKNSAIIVVGSHGCRRRRFRIGSRRSIWRFTIRSLLPPIRHAGSIFVGAFSPEAAGDYASGPNHVLPTAGAARLRGGLSAADFVKVISVQELDARRRWGNLRRPSRRWLAPKAWKAHARSVEVRLGRLISARRLQPRERARTWRRIRRRPAAARTNCGSTSTKTRWAARRGHRIFEERLTRGRLADLSRIRAARSGAGRIFRRRDPDELLLTNGTDEAIQVLINTYVDDGDDVLLLRPSYAMYRFYAELAGASIREVALSPAEAGVSARRISGRDQPDTRAILIANPNNPTGTGIDPRAASNAFWSRAAMPRC